MIDPKEKDIGRKVMYHGSFPAKPQEGYISSFNDRYVFVRYGIEESTSQATLRKDLDWLE